MTLWLWAGLGTLAYVLLFVGWLDRRTDSPWVVRDNYRLLSMGLVFVLILVLLKAISWRTELTTLMPYCK